MKPNIDIIYEIPLYVKILTHLQSKKWMCYNIKLNISRWCFLAGWGPSPSQIDLCEAYTGWPKN